MSDLFKKVLVIGAVLGITMVFIFQFRPAADAPTKSDATRCVAEVSGNCIMEIDYFAAFRLIAPSNASGEALEQLQLKQVVVEGLIERFLLNEDAKRLGITVSDDDISRHLVKGYARVSLPVAREDYYWRRLGLLDPPEGPARWLRVFNPETKKFEEKRYAREIRHLTKKTPADFRAFQRLEFLAARVRALVRARVQVSDLEGQAKFKRERETATVDYVSVQRPYYEKYVLDQSADALSGWIEQHQEDIDQSWESRKDSFMPECRVARRIFVRVDPAKAAADKDAAKAAAKEKIEKARKLIDGGRDFAEVADELGDRRAIIKAGGDLGCVGKGKLPKGLEEKLFAMKKGELSEAIESEGGFNLLKLEKIAKDDDAKAAGRKQIARELYLRLETERLAAEGAKQIQAAVHGGKPLEKAVEDHLVAVLPKKVREAAEKAAKQAAEKAEKKGKDDDEDGDEDDTDPPVTALTDPQRPQIKTSSPFTVGGFPFAGVKNRGKAVKVVFELEKAGDLASELIDLYSGYAVVQLKEKKPASDEDWAEARDGYLERLRREKQRDALVSYVTKLRSKHAQNIKYLRGLFDDESDEKDKDDKKKKKKKKKKSEKSSGD